MSTAAILTAAGSGVRLGRDLPKALVEVAGAPMVLHAARNLAASGVVDHVIVTAPPDLVSGYRELFAAEPTLGIPVTVTAGGGTRQESVGKAIAALPTSVEVVLVHDAARPFATPDLIRRVVETVRAGHRAVIPAVPVTDTIKQVSASSYAIGEPYRHVSGPQPDRDPDIESVAFTPPREHLRVTQTPQGFDRRTLDRAFAAGAARGAVVTDDAALVEGIGVEVVAIPGHESAAKITTERDLLIAELIHRDAESGDVDPAPAEAAE